MEGSGQSVELCPSGAKVFVRPDQHAAVISAVQDLDLKPRHIVVSQEIESLVTGVIERVKRTSVKRRRVAVTAPSYSEEPHVVVEIRRTFIHLEIPSSLQSAPSHSGWAASC